MSHGEASLSFHCGWCGHRSTKFGTSSAKAEDYPKWWPYVERATKISEGDDTGVGQVVRSRWSTALPYGFEFETEAIRVVKPSLLELASVGQLEGSGTWELSTTPEGTAVRYFWRVRTTKAGMDLVGADRQACLCLEPCG